MQTFPNAAVFGWFKSADFKLLLTCLSIGFIVRLVPEVLAFSTPIGFDTIHYASLMKSGVVFSNWSSFFVNTWLLDAFIVPLYSVFNVDPFVLLKFVAPMLYGLNVAGVYWFARKGLGWSTNLSLIAGVFFALQLASLRISWDLLRNTLGLAVLLFAFSYVKAVKSFWSLAAFSAFSLLSVFAHEFSAVFLLVCVFGLLFWKLLKNRFDTSTKRLLLGVLPALGVFCLGLYLRFFPVPQSAQASVIAAGDSVVAAVGGLPFLVNYLNVQSSVDCYLSYTNLVLSVGALFALLFLPYLLFVVKGLFKNGILTAWAILAAFGAFGCLIFPFCALTYWHRWMFLLVYPFTFYAIYGLSKLQNRASATNRFPRFHATKASTILMTLTFSLAFAYLASPISMLYANASVPSVSGTYLYFSDSPAVPYQDVDSVTQVMAWLNNTMPPNSCVLLHHAYHEWGTLHLSENRTIVTFQNNVQAAIETASLHGFSPVYFVWWNTPTDWYNVSVPEGFVEMQDFDRISIYTCESEVLINAAA
ncbi:MAG: hypothetical protein NWF04_00415 [Candidatus Bathyarchaeota archaeon]|nr:hypothetical protein [Candidatus Bathyarchaeota archaeon]